MRLRKQCAKARGRLHLYIGWEQWETEIAAELNSMCSSALTNTGDENGEEEKGSGDSKLDARPPR